jgi:hypothetical protein
MFRANSKGVLLALAVVLSAARPAMAQPAANPPSPAIRRWLDVQQLMFYTRYRFIENNADVTTANQLQYKDSTRARFNLDARKRYTINAGFFSGSSFTGSWDNWGAGTGDFDGKDHYVKQLYASAIPVPGFELQGGGIYTARGEFDEYASYDDDAFMMGTRASLKRPKNVYFDELTVTRAAIGPQNRPNISDRWDSFNHPDYTQALAVKQFSSLVGASLSYERQIGADIARAAVTMHLSKTAPVQTIRYEQYHRFNLHEASGLGLWAERVVSSHLRVQGGYVAIDRYYGGWNADRFQSGKRFFVFATIPIHGPFTAAVFASQALHADYAIPLKRRYDIYLAYDLLDSLRRAKIL